MAEVKWAWVIRDEARLLVKSLYFMERTLDWALNAQWSAVRKLFDAIYSANVAGALAVLDERLSDFAIGKRLRNDRKFVSESSVVRTILKVLLGRLFPVWRCQIGELELIRNEIRNGLQSLNAETMPSSDVLIAQRIATFDCRMKVSARLNGVQGIDNESLSTEWDVFLRQFKPDF